MERQIKKNDRFRKAKVKQYMKTHPQDLTARADIENKFLEGVPSPAIFWTDARLFGLIAFGAVISILVVVFQSLFPAC